MIKKIEYKKNNWKFEIKSKNKIYNKFLKENLIEDRLHKEFLPLNQSLNSAYKFKQFENKNIKNILSYNHIHHSINYNELDNLNLKIKYKNNLKSTRKSKIFLKEIEKPVISFMYPRLNDIIYPLYFFKERQNYYKYIIKYPLFKLYIFIFKIDNKLKFNFYINYPFLKNKFKMIFVIIKFPFIQIYINDPFSKKYYEFNLFESRCIFNQYITGGFYI